MFWLLFSIQTTVIAGPAVSKSAAYVLEKSAGIIVLTGSVVIVAALHKYSIQNQCNRHHRALKMNGRKSFAVTKIPFGGNSVQGTQS